MFNLFGSRSKKESEFRFLLKHKRSNVRRNNKKQMSRKHVNDCGRMSTQQHSCRSTNFLTEKHILQLVGTTATCRDQPPQYNFWINAFQKLLYQLSGVGFFSQTRKKLFDFFFFVCFGFYDVSRYVAKLENDWWLDIWNMKFAILWKIRSWMFEELFVCCNISLSACLNYKNT